MSEAAWLTAELRAAVASRCGGILWAQAAGADRRARIDGPGERGQAIRGGRAGRVVIRLAGYERDDSG
jgi:hypothetical protein